MKYFILSLFVLFQANAMAAEPAKLCEAEVTAAAQEFNKVIGGTTILQPGEDTIVREEVWNPTDEPVVVYVGYKFNGAYNELYAILASVKTCKILRVIEVGDDL